MGFSKHCPQWLVRGEHTKEIASTGKLSFHHRMTQQVSETRPACPQNELDNHRNHLRGVGELALAWL